MKNSELIQTNISALLALIVPFGISLTFEVLSFFLSISLSRYLLKAIAEDLAKIIHNVTLISNKISMLFVSKARKKPITEKGIAKIV